MVERWPDRDAIWLMAGDRTRIGLWRPQVGLERGRGGVHVHFAMHIAEADYDAAVAELRAKGAEVAEHEFGAYQHSRAAYLDGPRRPSGRALDLGRRRAPRVSYVSSTTSLPATRLCSMSACASTICSSA